MNLSITQFRATMEVIGRFASVREKAGYPRDRVLIQAAGGELKFVAGTERYMIALSAGEVKEMGMALVSARLLIGATKSLRGKGVVSITFDGKGGAQIKSGTGGAVKLPRMSDRIPNWPSPHGIDDILVKHDGLEPFPALIEATMYKHKPPVFAYVRDGILSVQFTDNFLFVGRDMRTTVSPNDPVLMAYDWDFFNALRGQMGPGWVMATNERIKFLWDGGYAVCLAFDPRHVSEWPPLDPSDVLDYEPETWIRVERRQLYTSLRSLVNRDELARVALMASGGTLRLWAYGHEDDGSISVPIAMSGKGSVTGANATMLSRLLHALPKKEVQIGWSRGEPITFKEGEGWRVCLAPVSF